MTTTEFIKHIKACEEGRKSLFNSTWEENEPIYLITESELDKIEKVNVELTEALNELRIAIGNIGGKWDRFLDKPYNKAMQAIKNASNIKHQI